MHNFDDLLDYLCAGIMSKSEKQSVRDELYDHLMCKYETNLAIGLNEEDAEQRAIEDLGDVSTLRHKLGQVHSYAPQLTLKKAINLLIFGYFLISFHISFFAGMKEITIFIGNVCMLVSLFCMRTANRNLKSAFCLKMAACGLSWFANAIEPVASVPFSVMAVAGVSSLVLHFVSMMMLIIGIKELVTPYLNTYPKNIPFNASLIFNVFEGITNVVIYCLFIDSGETSAEISSYVLFALLIIGIILNLIVFSRSSKALWNSDHEYKIEDSSGKKWIAAVVAIAVAVVPVLAVDFSLANQKAETTVYTIEDCDMSQSEYKRICNKMLAYGIPEKVIYSLPKSEIVNYSDCFEITEYSQREQNFIRYVNYDSLSETFDDGMEVRYSAMLFEIKESDGHSRYRILSWLDYRNAEKAYDEAFFFTYNQRAFIPINYDGEYNDNFLLILSEEDEKFIKNEPLDVYTDENALTDNITGVRFEGKENLLIIHAADYSLGDKGYLGNRSDHLIEFIHRKMIFSFPYRSAVDAKEISQLNDWGLVRTQIGSGGVNVPMPYEDDEYKDVTFPEVEE